ncbi:MAG: succinylglutamate desuccinylase/aspartoacylase family protein [Armatimonadetes bacterium]|nr:succinylglutamate desuccinylase/aspartoacylase family protein [Armatimonadota bacterium]
MTGTSTFLRWIDVCTLASGAPLRIAVHGIDGSDGPALGVSALIHGDEIVGAEVVRQVREAVDPARLRGRLRLVPVANPLAFQTLTRGTPLAVEIGNLNRVFPADPALDLPARLAHALQTQFLDEITHLVDLHAGGTFPIVDYSISLRDLDMALAFGQRVIRQVSGYAGTMGARAASQGKPSLVAEIGGGYALDGAYIEMGVRGVLNVMRHLGMIDGRPERPPRQVVLTEVTTLRPGHGGLLYSELGADGMAREVPGGTLLGRVVSPYTFETLQELRAPYARSVVLLLRSGVTAVNPGDYAYMLGNLEGARTITNH